MFTYPRKQSCSRSIVKWNHLHLSLSFPSFILESHGFSLETLEELCFSSSCFDINNHSSIHRPTYRYSCMYIYEKRDSLPVGVCVQEREGREREQEKGNFGARDGGNLVIYQIILTLCLEWLSGFSQSYVIHLDIISFFFILRQSPVMRMVRGFSSLGVVRTQ